MTLSALGERYDHFYAPRFVLRLDGDVYEQSRGTVTDVSVEAAAEKADRFSLTLSGVYDESEGEFAGLSWERFAIDTDVEIEMGYGETTETLLVGSIAEQRPQFPAEGGPRVEISGYGLMHELDDDSKSRSWDEATDSEVAEEVAGEYRFETVDVTPTDTVRPTVVQDDETDLAFLRRLAERSSDDDGGFEVTVRRDAFRFGPSEPGLDVSLELAYGSALQSFSPEYRTGSQVKDVEVRGYDEGAKSAVVGRAESDGPGSGTEIVRRQARSRAEAESAARARRDEIERERLSGRGQSIGLPEIEVGEVVRLKRLGERFTGPYLVESATHRVSTDGYTTGFEVRLPTGEDLE